MPRRGTGLSRQGRSSRRRTSWVTVDPGPVTLTATGAQTIDLLTSFKADGGTQQAVTIARTHLRIIPTFNLAQAQGFYVGLIRGQNADVGGPTVAGAPHPSTALYADWMLWEHLVVDSTSAGSFNEYGGRQLHYDLKSMRRLEELQMNYNLVLEVPPGPTFPVSFWVTGRILLILP